MLGINTKVTHIPARHSPCASLSVVPPLLALSFVFIVQGALPIVLPDNPAIAKDVKEALAAKAEAEAAADAKLTPEQRKKKLLDKADKLVRGDHFAKARPILEKILKDDPVNVQALRNMGCIYYQGNVEGKGFHRARQYFNRALKADPNDSASYRMKGEMALIDGNVDECIKLCTRAIACPKPDYFAYRTRAAALGNQKRFAEAQRDIEVLMQHAHKGTKTYSKALASKAALLENSGRFADAVPVYKELLAEQYMDDVVYKLSTCLTKSGKPAEAVEQLSKLIKINPEDEEAYMFRSRAYLAMNKNNEALQDLTKSIDIAPVTKTYMERAALYDKMGMKDKATKDREKAQEF